MDFRWRSVGDYLRAFDSSGTALNVIQLIGHGTLRVAAMGFARREPTPAELRRMQKLLADGIEDGAWGLSTGLIYPPGSYATTDEIVELASVAGAPSRLLREPHPRRGRDPAGRRERGDPHRARGRPAGADQSRKGGRAAELG